MSKLLGRSVATDLPRHADVWERQRIPGKPWQLRFTVMTVCQRHDPPHVTGYWHDESGPNECAHRSYPLPVFLDDFKLIEREC
jgi:hypothetical protein